MSTGADSPAAAAFGADDGGAGSSMVDSPAPPTPGGGYDDTASRSGTKRDATDAPTPGGDDSAGGGARKKKKTGPGSRGVANLTPEQLAKKRANGMCSPFAPSFALPVFPPNIMAGSLVIYQNLSLAICILFFLFFSPRFLSSIMHDMGPHSGDGLGHIS